MYAVCIYVCGCCEFGTDPAIEMNVMFSVRVFFFALISLNIYSSIFINRLKNNIHILSCVWQFDVDRLVFASRIIA